MEVRTQQLRLHIAFVVWTGLVGCRAADGAVSTERPEKPGQDEDSDEDTPELEGALPTPDAGQSARADTGPVAKPPAPPSDRGAAADAATASGSERGTADDDTCQEMTANHQVTAPDMLIVLDRSGSMIGFGEEFGVDRWTPTRTAVAAITAQFQDLISFGLSMFAAPDPSGIDLFSCATGQLDVPMALASSPAIIQAIDGATPLGGATPTGATLELAAEVLGDRATPADGARAVPGYVLLVTDGEPTCEEGPTEATPAAVARTNAAIERLLARGVKTYVVGYGLNAAAEVMNGFAQRGGTEHYYPVEDGTQLSAEFMRITGDVITCAYELEQVPRDRRMVEVKLDDAQLNLDPASGDGWTLEGTTVKLVGSPCAQLKDGQRHRLKIREVCHEVSPI